MATIFILLGSMLGFIAGGTLYFSSDIGLTAALLVWGGSGPLSALVVIAMAYAPLSPRADQPDDRVAETA